MFSLHIPRAFWDSLVPILGQTEVVRSESLVENLTCSLVSYAELLLAKKMKMQVVYSSQEVVQNISQNLTVWFIGVHAMPPWVQCVKL